MQHLNVNTHYISYLTTRGLYLMYDIGKYNSEYPKAWELLEALLLKMKQISEDNGAQFLLFSASYEKGKLEYDIRNKFIYLRDGFVYTRVRGVEYRIDWKKPREKLMGICQRNNIPFIKQKREYTRYRFDGHPNKIGNRNMAEDVVDFFVEWSPLLRKLNRRQ